MGQLNSVLCSLKFARECVAVVAQRSRAVSIQAVLLHRHEPHRLAGFEDASCCSGVDLGVSVAALHCSMRLCMGLPTDTLAPAATPRLHAGFSMAQTREAIVLAAPCGASIVEDSAQLGVRDWQPSTLVLGTRMRLKCLL